MNMRPLVLWSVVWKPQVLEKSLQIAHDCRLNRKYAKITNNVHRYRGSDGRALPSLLASHLNRRRLPASSALHPNPITAASPFMPSRNGKYYFEDENVIFQVEVDHLIL